MREYGKAIESEEFFTIFKSMEAEALSSLGNEIDSFVYYKYKISFIVEKPSKLFFCFISDNTDDKNKLFAELRRLRDDFFDYYSEIISFSGKIESLEAIHPVVDSIHRNLKPKISLVGYSGVGKTTITKLIKSEQIPMQHIPTISGEVSTIKIGNLYFLLWDFAGQEQFSFLWNKFIKGSDAVLIITDSSLENIEKSQFFLELIRQEAPFAHVAIIGNKQDIPDALSVDKIEELMGMKAYAMIAIDPRNREKMIQIIADILDINAELSPLLEPLIKRDQLIENAKNALEQTDLPRACNLFDRISDLCMDLGDHSHSKEFYEKSQKIKKYLEIASIKQEGDII